MSTTRDLVKLDGMAGLAAGVLMFAASSLLETWYGLPLYLILAMGAANILYGLYSSTLARMQERPMWRLSLLAIANMAWGCFCFILAALHAKDATWLGVAHLIGEGAFVGGLGAYEWRVRESLRTRPR